MIRFLCAALIYCLGAGLMLGQAQAEQGDAILVLDASGSMWGQIDGENKIVIARRVIDQLLTDLPAERRLGLVAYGHNRKGDCTDIEQLAAVGAPRADISAAVNALNPKGKTPLSASVKFAAEQLKYTETKATVILVSDGIETCDLDPCAVGAELEALGVDFTAHVVGFDVGEIEAAGQLQCLAENTGGKFIRAKDAEELADALQETVAAPEPAAIVETKFALRATELTGGPVVTAGLTWTIKRSDNGEVVFEAADAGEVEAVVPGGTYDIFVERPADGLKGEAKKVFIRAQTEKFVTIALEFALEAKLSLTPEGEAPVSSEIVVTWEGPNRQGDFVTVVEPDAPAGGYKSYQYTREGNPLKLRMPADAGDYEVRYVLGRPNRILARVPIKAVAVEASLEGPETVAAGAQFEVTWIGPGYKDDWVTIVKPDERESGYLSYAYTRDGNPLQLKAPLEPGAYELRYVQAGKRVIARRPIAVTGVEAAITAPDEAETGEYIKVGWTGPGGQNDFLTTTVPDAKDSAYTDYAYTRDGTELSLRMPLEAGSYEIRYVQAGKKVLARHPITIVETTVKLTVPPKATAGGQIEIVWEGPDNKNDYISIAAKDAAERAYASYNYTRNGSPMKLDVPVEPGDYEIRYVLGGQRAIARAPVTVEDASATLDAPDSVAAGGKVDIAFDGPGFHRDYISFAEPGSADRAYATYNYTRTGSPVTLNVPKKPGTYELRYVLGGQRAIARRPITVTAE